MPGNYLHVTTGFELVQLSAGEDEGVPINYKALGILTALGVLALLPTLFRKKFTELEQKLERNARGD